VADGSSSAAAAGQFPAVSQPASTHAEDSSSSKARRCTRNTDSVKKCAGVDCRIGSSSTNISCRGWACPSCGRHLVYFTTVEDATQGIPPHAPAVWTCHSCSQDGGGWGNVPFGGLIEDIASFYHANNCALYEYRYKERYTGPVFDPERASKIYNAPSFASAVAEGFSPGDQQRNVLAWYDWACNQQGPKLS